MNVHERPVDFAGSNIRGIILCSFPIQISSFFRSILIAIVDTVFIAIVWILGLTSGRLSDTILRLRVVNLTITVLAPILGVLITEAGVIVLVVGIVRVVVDGGAICGMALTICIELIRMSMLRQVMTFFGGSSLATTEKTAQKTTLGTIARGVIVSRTGAEAFLLAVVASKSNLDHNGEYEEDTVEVSIAVCISLDL